MSLQLDEFSAAPVILDGAWGTELQALGLQPGSCPDTWNVAAPDRVQSVASAYAEAGSQILLTNTFGANRISLSRCGQSDYVDQLNHAGARISLGAAAGRARVFASIGPTGKLLAQGDVTESDLQVAFEEQARALAKAGVHGLVLETFSCLDELRIALSAAKATGLPVVACMVFDSGKDRDRTAMGVSPELAASALSQAGADAIGANCGRGIDGCIPICRRMRGATDLPLWFKPNAGLPRLVDGQATYDATPEQFAVSAKLLVEAGAHFVGGCCGTNPAFIRALASAFGHQAKRA
jgi:5-methyltetrahydrofolate--homocysteine methyltransferase